MTQQLALSFQDNSIMKIEKPERAQRIRDWRYPYLPTDPVLIRLVMLGLLLPDEWMHWYDVCDLIPVDPSELSFELREMEREGLIESMHIYIGSPPGEGNYLGYQDAYRLSQNRSNS